MSRSADIAIVGAGIVGLAHALAAARQGRSVTVFDRSIRARGASIRNFGLVWPIGQHADLYDTALRSREIWLEIAAQTDMWMRQCGSLCIARSEQEMAVLQQFLDNNSTARSMGCQMLDPAEVVRLSPNVRFAGLLGGLWSPTELNVEPRLAIPELAAYLHSRYGVQFEFCTSVYEIDMPRISTTRGNWEVNEVLVCAGAEYDTLYPAEHTAELQRCKLQMMRTEPQPDGWHLGPALCSGLSMLHYASFQSSAGLIDLQNSLDSQYPQHQNANVHALVSQTPTGQLSIGDSHEYGDDLSPFGEEPTNDLITDYLAEWFTPPNTAIAEHWLGVYAVSKDGRAVVRSSPSAGVTIVNGLAGAGMTLSFAEAEKTFATR